MHEVLVGWVDKAESRHPVTHDCRDRMEHPRSHVNMFVTINMGRADPEFVDPFELCFEFDPDVVHVDCPLEQSP